ncbi:alpha/beta fold hydrolase [Rhodococcus rhodnii]|uniref:Xaa-Pro dipeptidyl-peptidase-like domain-containing protein n=2 Tax=Rhodococcus rhodnii TaxID=38312 RepID=R7WI50_9NOCA|nr:CocE/NonD family hydrolase [Rhodococcus rhodnii]EOM74835.1 hypothetical protein Rrhod_3825 [Rhodococcus rhodnii LMG 5362]TXG90990.1 alpha/beta fold hydrolase [Rhodococcus rhodnii]
MIRAPHHCVVRDGAVLAGHRYEPATRPRGTVLMRTPYDAGAHGTAAAWWVRLGFRVVVQDVRGRYRSDGRWLPYRSEADDGADTATRLDPPVVAVGTSYGAHCAVELARAAPVAAVVAMVPALGLHETATRNGTRCVRDRLGWWHEHGFGRFSAPPAAPERLDHATETARRRGIDRAPAALGWPENRAAAWRRLWDAPPLDFTDRYADARAPLLVLGGDHDFFAADAVRLAQSWPVDALHVSGPWGHRLLAGVPEPMREALRAHGGPGTVVAAWLGGVLGDRPGPHPRTGSRVLDPDAGWRHHPTRPKERS